MLAFVALDNKGNADAVEFDKAGLCKDSEWNFDAAYADGSTQFCETASRRT